jgi:hypothetical protein
MAKKKVLKKSRAEEKKKPLTDEEMVHQVAQAGAAFNFGGEVVEQLLHYAQSGKKMEKAVALRIMRVAWNIFQDKLRAQALQKMLGSL